MKSNIIRHILRLTFTLLIGISLGGCTINNGDIGLWFGTWYLDTKQSDPDFWTAHLPEVTAQGNTLQFQSSVIRLAYNSEGSHREYFGTWHHEGFVLQLKMVVDEYNPDQTRRTKTFDLKIIEPMGDKLVLVDNLTQRKAVYVR